MKRIGNFFVFVYLFFFVSTVFASSIVTKVSTDQVEVGDVFSVTVEVTFKDGLQPQISIYEIPKDPKISFLQQSKGFAQRTTITNGVSETKKSISLNMSFYAKEVGNVKVPIIKLQINNKVFAAKGFKIEVVAKGKGSSQSSRGRPQNPMSGMESLLNEFFGRGSTGKNNWGNGSDVDFFIDVETSTMNPYFSEQFVANWYLYTNGRITDIDTLKYPALEGFWKDEISLATSLTPEPVERNGKMFTRYLLASYALTPIIPDQAFIDPYEVKCQLVGGLFSFGSKEFVRKSDEVLIRVKPLPQNRPEGFTGAVGDFQVSSMVNERAFKVGQPFTYTVRISGDGQLKFMEMPDLGLNENEFEIYDVTEESQFIPPKKSVKTYKYLIVPKKSGELEIPQTELWFFDPVKAKFYSAKTRALRIHVGQGEAIVQDIVSVYDESKKDVFVPELYMKLSSSTFPAFTISSLATYVIYFFCLLLSSAVVIFSYFGNKIIYDFEKDLRQRFKHLEELIENNKWREASTQAVNIVYFFANSKSKKKPKSQKLEDILGVLPVGLRRDIEDSMKALNTDLQRYSFAPDDLLKNSDVKAKVLEKCLALKDLLERSSKDDFKN